MLKSITSCDRHGATVSKTNGDNRITMGFTLIELLVVIAIIATLAAILFPVFAQAREKSRETVCISNSRQIGLAVRMYVQDYDETFPIFHAYNTQPAAQITGHKGIETELAPYTKNADIFKCPDDTGGPVPQNSPSAEYGCADLPGKNGSYFSCYGSSYRFTSGLFTVVGGADGSFQNNAPTDGTFTPHVITDAALQVPADSRIMRDEMLPWFGGDQDKDGATYGYYPDYYRRWHARGGGFIFADGHSKFVAKPADFRTHILTPDGKTFETCGYACD